MGKIRMSVMAALIASVVALPALAQSLGDANGGGLAPPPGVAPPTPAGATATPGTPAGRACADCGVVTSIRYVEQQAPASGVGAVAGGVLGGVLGHQIGNGRGNTAATIAGVGAGAYAGHQIEKSQNRKIYWTVALRMDDGRTRSFTYSAQPTVREGERVRLADGGKRLVVLAN